MRALYVIMYLPCIKYNFILLQCTPDSGHVYSGHSDIVTTFPGTEYIYIFFYIQVGYCGQSDIVAQGSHYIRSALYK